MCNLRTHNNSTDVGLLHTQIIPFRLKTYLFLIDSFNVVCILKGKHLFSRWNKKFLTGKCLVTSLWTGWLTNCDLNAVGARESSLLQNIQISSGVHPASYSKGIRGSLPWGIKLLGHEADHSPPSGAEVKSDSDADF
jgi:hypothetical protein